MEKLGEDHFSIGVEEEGKKGGCWRILPPLKRIRISGLGGSVKRRDHPPPHTHPNLRRWLGEGGGKSTFSFCPEEDLRGSNFLTISHFFHPSYRPLLMNKITINGVINCDGGRAIDVRAQTRPPKLIDSGEMGTKYPLKNGKKLP